MMCQILNRGVKGSPPSIIKCQILNLVFPSARAAGAKGAEDGPTGGRLLVPSDRREREQARGMACFLLVEGAKRPRRWWAGRRDGKRPSGARRAESAAGGPPEAADRDRRAPVRRSR